MQYKCPNCSGGLEFDTESQNVKCPYCDSEFNVADLAEYDTVLETESEENESFWEREDRLFDEDEAQNISLYTCKTCGGEIIADDTTGATQCPYCGNPVIMMGKFAGGLKPDLVIPFKYDKKAAKAKFEEFTSKKRFIPKLFRDESHIDEIKGVYIPFWIFDAKADGKMRFKGTKVRTWTKGNYDYIETSHYAIIREGNIRYEGVPVDGSSKMPDDLMESVCPFDFKNAVDFQTAYLSGYLADKYDVDSEVCRERANSRIRTDFTDELNKTVIGYGNVECEYSNISLSDNKLKYALYPVWLLNTTWKGQKFTFAMNGETGKMVGNLPMDKKKVLTTGLIASAISSAVACLIAFLMTM